MADHKGGQDSFNQAVVVPCVERDVTREGAPITRPLPWSFLTFGGETTRYVLVGGGIAADPFGVALLPQQPESMRFKPFPHELDRPAVSASSGDLAKPGPIGVQFFGNV